MAPAEAPDTAGIKDFSEPVVPDMGYGPGKKGFNKGSGCNAWANLNEEQISKLQEKRSAFFEETQALRQDIFSKRLEIKSEVYKREPDTAKALSLQKDLSELKAQLAQKRVAHIIDVRKINPGQAWGESETAAASDAAGGGNCWR